MNAGFFVRNFPIVASTLAVGQSAIVSVGGECEEVTRIGEGTYAFAFRRLPDYDTHLAQANR